MRLRLAREARLSLVPTIDVVFQLIAFFIFALSFDQTKASALIQPPLSHVELPDQIAEVDEILIELDSTGNLSWNGKQIDGSSEVQLVEFRKLLSDQEKDSLLCIRADRLAASGRVLDLAAECRAAGFEGMRFRVKLPTQGSGEEHP
jgi:biopolymer transport protein ExbD